MATFPIELPSGYNAREAEFTAQSVTSAPTSPFSLVPQYQVHPGQRWHLVLDYPPLEEARGRELTTKLLLLNGMENTLLAGFPRRATPLGAATGTLVENGSGSSGNVLPVRGATLNTTNILKAGDMIQRGSGSSARLHMVLEDVDSDGAGEFSATVWPDLRSVTVDGAALVTTDPKGVFRLAENKTTWSLNVVRHYGISLSISEDIP